MNLFPDGGIGIFLQLSISRIFYCVFSYYRMPLDLLCDLVDSGSTTGCEAKAG